MDGSALADQRSKKNPDRKSTLTDGKEVHPIHLNTLHSQTTPN
jgi:hypothetical protein